MNWFKRLFTVSKHVDPTVAAAVQPTLDAAHAAVTTATSAINPAIDVAVAAADSLAGVPLAKLSVASQLLTPAARAGVSLAAQAVIGALQSKLGLQPGDTAPAATAG